MSWVRIPLGTLKEIDLTSVSFFAVACFALSARPDTPQSWLNVKFRLLYILSTRTHDFMTEVDFDTVCPQKPVFSWTGAAQSMRSEPFGVARAACFEQLAGVFASCGALHYVKILASLKIKNGISLTPLNCALNAFTFALNDSADALVERLSK